MSDPVELEDNFTLVISDQGVATPTAHAASHAAAGSDPLTLTLAQISNAGTIASQAANNVTITGGTISVTAITATSVNLDGGTIDGTVIGGTTRAAGSFTAVVGTTGTFSAGVSGTTGAFSGNTTIGGTLAVTGALTLTVPLAVAQGGTGGTSQASAQAFLGIGTMGLQNKTLVDIEGGTIDATVIGGGTPAAGSFTTVVGTTGAFSSNVSVGGTLAVTGALTLTVDLTVPNGGTGASSLAGILRGNGASAFTAITSSTVGRVLRVTGSDTYDFGAVDLADGDAVTGLLPIANGGTNASSAAAARVSLGFNSGRSTLVTGVVVVADPAIVAASSVVVATAVLLGGTPGTISVALTDGVGFTINSSSATDTSTIAYVVIY